jgi:preprotein translocase subunit SecA
LQPQFGIAFSASEPPLVVDGKPAQERDELAQAIFDITKAFIEEKRKTCDALSQQHSEIGYPPFAVLERDFLLQILDTQWKDHLHTMDGLREGIGLRGFAQRDPKLEYQREGYALFEEMNQRIDQQSVEVAFRFALPEPVAAPPAAARRAAPPAPGASPAQAGAAGKSRAAPGKTGKVGRNDPCTCGSGKKFKKCCGA